MMNKNKYPILIPIKGNSIRCPNKNKILLPYTVTYLKKINRLENAVVITDNIKLGEYAESLGIKTYFEVCKEDQDELISCDNFVKNVKINEEYFFLMPVTHPFRTLELCNLFEKEREKYIGIDFIVSSNIVTDRSNFFVDSNKNFSFLYSKRRMGKYCKQIHMVEGSLYLINKHFLSRIVQRNDSNYYFWEGNFRCVINEAPFIDIDTMDDLRRFNFIIEIIKKIW
ncbi:MULTISPECIES: hypothetical protein [Capnocytophaga]|nr:MULTISPECIES: hypothetical protein [Capnocytophaga]